MTEPAIAQLQRTHTRLVQLIANLDGGVLVEDETRHISLVNQAFCDLFGIPVPPRDLIGADCSNSVEASKGLFNDPDGFVQRINELLAAQVSVTGEVLHLADGRVFSRDYIPVYDNDMYIGHLWHYHDISDRVQSHRRMERLLQFEEVNREIVRLFLQLDDLDEALNRALAVTGQLLDVSRVYVFRFRENARIVDNTHEWCAPGVKPEIDNLQGLAFDEILPSFFPMIAENDLIAPRHISELPVDVREILEPQDIQTVLWMPMYLDNRIEGFVGYDETRHPRTWLPEEITLARILMESYARALERHRTQQLLIQARDEAVRTAQLRAQFVANMSHEIRTPMTGVLGMLELLLETDLDELQQEFAGDAMNSSSRLLEIINAILDFSKLESGQIVLEAEPIDLAAIATEVRMTLAPQVKDRPVKLELIIDPQLPRRVHGDATRIRQVLMNLVGNAVKFTQSGFVRLWLDLLRVQDGMAYIRCSVTDTGIGIAPEKLPYIFDSFVQADGSTTRKYGGSGLGLSISRQLVELMGSHIEAESVPDQGSTFSFTLRLPVSQHSTGEMTPIPDLSMLRVLVVDADRTSSYVLTQQLKNWGIQVIQRPHLHDEVMTLPHQQFDLLFWRSHNAPADPTISAMLRGAAAKTVFILDQDAYPPAPGQAYLRWPVNPSSLYNLLAESLSMHEMLDNDPPSGEIRGHVLLAEDSEINVELVQRALTDIQIQVDCVGNGEEALKQLERAVYDLVLMDIQMPVMDGREAIQHIRELDTAYRNIPILVLTASVMREERETYLELGANDVISKPFSVKQLRQVVMDWLR